jgi:hypothetical protein
MKFSVRYPAFFKKGGVCAAKSAVFRKKSENALTFFRQNDIINKKENK